MEYEEGTPRRQAAEGAAGEMSEEEFDAALDASIGNIYSASIT